VTAAENTPTPKTPPEELTADERDELLELMAHYQTKRIPRRFWFLGPDQDRLARAWYWIEWQEKQASAAPAQRNPPAPTATAVEVTQAPAPQANQPAQPSPPRPTATAVEVTQAPAPQANQPAQPSPPRPTALEPENAPATTEVDILRKLSPKPRLAARIVLELRREGFPLGKRDTLLQEVRKRSGKKELSLRSLDTALHKLRGLNLFD
jgi:hypothetical protein